jgi:hypothetical protein
MSMRDSVIRTRVRELQLAGSTRGDEPVQIVCLALIVALTVLAVRIVNVW